MSTDETVLLVQQLHKRFGDVIALDGLSLMLARGEIYGLLGANGAGKTTLLRILCGLLAADGGNGHCLGNPLGKVSDALGYVLQRGGLYDDLTVAENLRFYAYARGLTNAGERVQRMLETHTLVSQADRLAGTLSGGWRQRVALACALLHAPRLLLLDEPTVGLDGLARESLWNHLHSMAAAQTGILVTTHYADEALRCNRIGYIAAGRVCVEGVPDQLANKLQLAVWRVKEMGKPLHCIPTVSGVRFSHDASGWRAITRADGLPVAMLKAWSRQHLCTLHPLTPCLSDALLWLASEAEA